MNYLWSDVVWGPAECLGHGPITDVLLAHPKVGYLDVAVLVEHDVVQLEVPVDHTQGVEEDDANGDFSGVKPAEEETVSLDINLVDVGTDTATGSLNFPHCWIWYIKSPPLTNSITKYRRS